MALSSEIMPPISVDLPAALVSSLSLSERLHSCCNNDKTQSKQQPCRQIEGLQACWLVDAGSEVAGILQIGAATGPWDSCKPVGPFPFLRLCS